MRKIVSFLALLVMAFALPQWAHAWDYDSNSDPSQITVHLVNGTVQELPLTYEGSATDYKWRSDYFESKVGYVNFTVQVWNGDKSYNATYGSNDFGAESVDTWVNVTNNPTSSDSGKDRFYQLGLEAGKYYRIEIKAGEGKDAFKFRFVPAIDFDEGVNPTEITLELNNGTHAELSMTYDATGADYKWYSEEFESNDGFVNFWVFTKYNDDSQKRYGNNSGNGNPGQWVNVSSTAASGSQTMYQSGLTAGKRYRAEIAGDGLGNFKFRFVEVEDKAPETLYLYNMNGNAVTKLGSSANVGDTYTFTARVEKGQQLILSKNDKATLLPGAQSHNGRFSPSGAKNVPGENIDFTQNNSGYWVATVTGTYTITVDWASKKLTAKADNVEFDGPASLYLYGTLWATFLGQAAAGSDGVFRYTVKLSTDQHVGLSTNPSAANWYELGTNDEYAATYTYYSPGGDKEIPADGTAYSFTAARSGSWKATKTGTYHIAVDWAGLRFRGRYEVPIPQMTHMP
ncbi:MAG: hypothetical protein K2I25_02945, partial [Muribaculaceae bacterium]|nr:hypothetical protein [Muribaculaceae bacterium]